MRLLQSKWFYALLAVLAGGWWWWNASHNGAGSAGGAGVRVSVAPVERKDVPNTVALVGTVVATETVAVKSRLDSQITNVLFKDGEMVKEGQVLFELDDRALNAQIKEMEASVTREKAQLAWVKVQYDRAVKLVQSKTVAQAQVDSTRAAYESQLAQVGVAQSTLDSSVVQLTYTKITAPISGRAGTINVTRGNNVKANDTQPLVTINQISPIRAQFSIPQRYYDQVKAAMAQGSLSVLAARNESQEAPAEGTLEYVDNAIDAGTGTFAARASFANEEEKLWPGMFVKVTLGLGTEKDALTVPAVAVQGDEGSHFVFTVADGGKKAVRTPVEILRNTGDVAIIAKGLSETDKVITDGLLRVTDNGAIDIATPLPVP